MKYTFQTDSAAEGLRIDACIRRFFPELPSRAVQEAFSHRDVKLDGSASSRMCACTLGNAWKYSAWSRPHRCWMSCTRMRMYCWSTSGRASA